MTFLKRALLVTILAGIAGLMVYVIRADVAVPAPPMPDVVEHDWGPVEPLKRQTQERARQLESELANQ
jgi:hypothetical protein